MLTEDKSEGKNKSYSTLVCFIYIQYFSLIITLCEIIIIIMDRLTYFGLKQMSVKLCEVEDTSLEMFHSSFSPPACDTQLCLPKLPDTGSD